MAAAMYFQMILLVLISSFLIPTPSASQSTPQNIQVYFPLPITPPPTTAVITTSSTSSSGRKTIAKAVAVTAATSLVFSGLLFLLFFKFKRRSKVQATNVYADTGSQVGLHKDDEFVRAGGIKGEIVDEQGLDVLYWRSLEENNAGIPLQQILKNKDNGSRSSKSQFEFDSPPPAHKIPLLLTGISSTSHTCPVDYKIKTQTLSDSLLVVTPLESLKTQPSMKSHAPPLPPLQPSNAAILVPPPPPPQMVVVEIKSNASPPPVPIVVEMKGNAPPPPPPPTVVVKRMGKAPPPPLPPKTDGLTSPSRQTPQLTAKGDVSSSNDKQVRFKPLHWEKVNANVEHFMVWHKLSNGSFRVNDNLMESLFGTMPIDKKTPLHGASSSPSPKAQMKSGLSQLFLLDTRKSQNIAIVVKSLAISRSKIIHSLLQGKGLDTDTLEKLTRISPSEEDIKLILQFEGDIRNLADAESFIYHVTKAVPAAFTRVRIMLFKSNFRSEVSDVKKSLETLEMACKELKTQGLFVKLLEAVLKAGNRMNVGTSRGNAQAFNLHSLLKLSDVKSSDGKTTLLHFVVEEVVRSEGKRCNIKRNHSSSRSVGGLSTGAFTENYYIKLGLPVVGGVSSEFSNVKKAAAIDYDALSKSCSGLSDHLSEITETVKECDRDGNGGCLVSEMLTFLKVAKREIQMLREEEERIMGLVKITNEYYQAGTSKGIGGKPFQLFVIIRGFLNMVDKACLDIAIKLQKRRTGGRSPEAAIQMSTSPARPPMKFPILPANFRSTTSSSSSSDSD
uniref:formin-like protein 4 n=1 Tax=Erigeron canadensis TaxID=72917 RepID=UPI001CB914D1|nr:formin-like protein 4 [Erigeron canadensis]